MCACVPYSFWLKLSAVWPGLTFVLLLTFCCSPVMVRMWCMPKSPEEQMLKKMSYLSDADKGIMAEILEVSDYGNVQVALCTDGGSDVASASIAFWLRKVYATILGIAAVVNVRPFSFVSNDIAQQRQTLLYADIFWFAGVHGVSPRLREALSPTGDETGVNNLAAKVRERFQYDLLTYVGVCGGATMASGPEVCAYGACGLGLLNGRQVSYAYHCEVSRSSTPIYTDDRLLFTEKVSFAVRLSPTRCAAVCFACVKNSGCAYDFATSNSVVLQSIMQRLASEWKEFRGLDAESERWFFNLRGFYRLRDSDEVHFVSDSLGVQNAAPSP